MCTKQASDSLQAESVESAEGGVATTSKSAMRQKNKGKSTGINYAAPSVTRKDEHLEQSVRRLF